MILSWKVIKSPKDILKKNITALQNIVSKEPIGAIHIHLFSGL